MKDGKAWYREYLKGEHWKQFRQWVYSRLDGKNCRICNTMRRLNIHHLHYRTVGAETLEDIIVLCRGCHRKHHARLVPEEAMNWAVQYHRSKLPRIESTYQKLVTAYRQALRSRDFNLTNRLYHQACTESYDQNTRRHIQEIGKRLAKYEARKIQRGGVGGETVADAPRSTSGNERDRQSCYNQPTN